jgi:hypothetical protein
MQRFALCALVEFFPSRSGPGEPPLRRFLGRELQAVQRQRAFDPSKIKMAGAENLEVAELIAQAELVVSLELATMAGSANALKVFAAVWIACS